MDSFPNQNNTNQKMLLSNVADLSSEKMRMAEATEEIKRDLILVWKKRNQGKPIFSETVSRANPHAVDFLLSFSLVHEYDEIARLCGLDFRQRSALPQIIWKIFLEGKIDNAEEIILKSFPLNADKLESLIGLLGKKILSKLGELNSKNFSDKENRNVLGAMNKGETQDLKRMSLQEALAQDKEVGEQLLTQAHIKLRLFPDPVRASIKNWIVDYYDHLGPGKHGTIERGNFLFHSENGNKLNSAERRRLAEILKSLDEDAEITVNMANRKIEFESDRASSFKNRSKENESLNEGNFRDSNNGHKESFGNLIGQNETLQANDNADLQTHSYAQFQFQDPVSWSQTNNQARLQPQQPTQHSQSPRPVQPKQIQQSPVSRPQPPRPLQTQPASQQAQPAAWPRPQRPVQVQPQQPTHWPQPPRNKQSQPIVRATSYSRPQPTNKPDASGSNSYRKMFVSPNKPFTSSEKKAESPNPSPDNNGVPKKSGDALQSPQGPVYMFGNMSVANQNAKKKTEVQSFSRSRQASSSDGPFQKSAWNPAEAVRKRMEQEERKNLFFKPKALENKEVFENKDGKMSFSSPQVLPVEKKEAQAVSRVNSQKIPVQVGTKNAFVSSEELLQRIKSLNKNAAHNSHANQSFKIRPMSASGKEKEIFLRES